jgi:hypothetical protein
MTTTFTVANETQLNTAIQAIDAGGADAAANTAYTIDITGQISLTSELPAINLDSGSSVTIAGTNGAGGPQAQTIDGNNSQQGFFVSAGNVTLENLTIADAVAQGGGGVGGGGGGAGLGGGLFVAAAGNVTLDNVGFAGDLAKGGAGGSHGPGGGGGGLDGGAGGGLGGAGSGGDGGRGGFGGGGGGATEESRIPRGHSGGFGGFGGGGGAGAPGTTGGAGGFGGFGGGRGNGGATFGGGGGGLGAGGDIFVQQGGSLTIEGGSLSGGSVAGGAGGSTGAGSGSAYGSGIFIQGNQTITFAPPSGQALAIGDVIADQSGSGGSGSNAGTGSVTVNGAGTVVLSATNTYTGGTTLEAGTLEVAALGAAGSGAVTFASGDTAALAVDNAALSANALANTIAGFVAGDTIDLTGLGYVSGQTTATLSGTTLTVTNGTTTDTLSLSGVPSGTRFLTAADAGGTGTKVSIGVDPGPTARNGSDTVGHNQTVNLTSVIDVLVMPGLAGDTETLTKVSAVSGTATVSNGMVSYTAPTTGPDTLSYTVQDQYGDQATGKVNITVDPGPTAGDPHLYIAPGASLDMTSLLLALDTQGMSGDTLSLTGATGNAKFSNGDVTYTAPGSGGSDTFSYTVADQLGDTANGTVNVTLDPNLAKNENLSLTGSGDIIDGLGGKNINVSLTGNSNTVLLGGGNDQVSLTGNNNTATLGNGNDTVTVSGTGNIVTAGSGNDVFNLGAGMTTLTMHGLHDSVSVNGGNDTIADTAGGADKLQLNIGAQGGTLGITNFDVANAVVSLVQTLAGAEHWTGPAKIAAAVTTDNNGGSLLSLGSYGKIDFVGVPTGKLTANNFQIS